MSSYCGGRFTVPPGFDFKILPQKSKSVVVISIIGSFDSFNGRHSAQLVDNFLKKSPFSLPSADSPIKGYYDCERQLVFLHYRDLEKLLDELLTKFKSYEKFLEAWDSERLKHLFFLFIVSHFIVISAYGTRLDTKYIFLFKLLNRLRHNLYPILEPLLRTLPIPRYCISIGRIMVPRLLFVFKLPPTIIARKLARDDQALFDFERNLTYQIFHVFYESGLLGGNSSEGKLFDLSGYNYVHVIPPDTGTLPREEEDDKIELSNQDDLAQTLLETLVSAAGIPSLSVGTDVKPDKPSVYFPPPSAPSDRSFSEFLQCQLTSLLEDPHFGKHSDNHTPYSFELPSCKGWFTACYKLYTSLFIENEANTSPESNADCLYQQWQQFLPSNGEADEATVTLFATQSQLDRQLSTARCETALIAAEAHYRQDLPLHYSRTYHLARVVSSYNVFLRLARGSAVVPTLNRLTRRLARLYLAGRVGCPVVLVSGEPCRQELHTLPERFPGLASALRSLESKGDIEGSLAQRLIKHLKLILDKGIGFTHRDSRSSKSRRDYDILLSDCLQDVPLGLMGSWRYAWIEGAVKIIEEQRRLEVKATSADEKTTSLQHLSVMPHRSDRRYISYCNCGRLQAIRLDPFDYQEANWTFYNDLELACCSKVAHIPLAPLILCCPGHNFCTHLESHESEEEKVAQSRFLVETDSSDRPQDNRLEATGSDKEEELMGLQFERKLNLPHRGVSNKEDDDDSDKFDFESVESDTTSEESDSSLTVSTSQDSTHNLLTRPRRALISTSIASEDGNVEEEEGKEGRVDDVDAQKVENKAITSVGDSSSQVNTKKRRVPVNFISGMPILGQPIGTMPLYPSWSIHALGKYFSYSHSTGMALPGFLRGSHFLLPWDVQASHLSSQSATPLKSTRSGRHRESDTVKLFIGFEMECPMGHRFFLAGPDRAMTGTMQASDVRRAVSALLNSDLPLYLPCRCSPESDTTSTDCTGAGKSEEMETETSEKSGRRRADAGITDKTVWAQLMRIYVAIPSVHIRVGFAPMIRPGPIASNCPIFHLGPTLDQQLDFDNDDKGTTSVPRYYGIKRNDEKGEIKGCPGSTDRPGYVYLENGSIWVARLPFAYQNGDRVYRRPQDHKQINECCLIRGSLWVNNDL